MVAAPTQTALCPPAGGAAPFLESDLTRAHAQTRGPAQPGQRWHRPARALGERAPRGRGAPRGVREGHPILGEPAGAARGDVVLARAPPHPTSAGQSRGIGKRVERGHSRICGLKRRQPGWHQAVSLVCVGRRCATDLWACAHISTSQPLSPLPASRRRDPHKRWLLSARVTPTALSFIMYPSG